MFYTVLLFADIVALLALVVAGVFAGARKVLSPGEGALLGTCFVLLALHLSALLFRLGA